MTLFKALFSFSLGGLDGKGDWPVKEGELFEVNETGPRKEQVKTMLKSKLAIRIKESKETESPVGAHAGQQGVNERGL